MARTTKSSKASTTTAQVEDYELSTGQTSAANRLASKLALAAGHAPTTLNILALPKTFFGAIQMVGHVVGNDDTQALSDAVGAMKDVLEETKGMTRGQLRNIVSPTRAAKAEKRAAAKAKREAAKAPKATPAKKAVAKKVAQKPTAAAKAKATVNSNIDVEAINNLLNA